MRKAPRVLALAAATATPLAVCCAPSSAAVTASALAGVTRAAPRVLDRASAYNLIEAFDVAWCWDCSIGIDSCLL